MDLNPESVDFNRGKVRLIFTDAEADEVLRIYLTEDDAWRLHEMIREKCNMLAKQKRGLAEKSFDITF